MSTTLTTGCRRACVAQLWLTNCVNAQGVLFHLLQTVYVRFKVDPENTTVYQGHTAVLHCQASSDPEPHIHWMVKDKTLDISKDRR